MGRPRIRYPYPVPMIEDQERIRACQNSIPNRNCHNVNEKVISIEPRLKDKVDEIDMTVQGLTVRTF